MSAQWIVMFRPGAARKQQKTTTLFKVGTRNSENGQLLQWFPFVTGYFLKLIKLRKVVTIFPTKQNKVLLKVFLFCLL